MIIVTANVGLLPFEIGKTRSLYLLKACSNARYALGEAKRFPKWANYDTPNTATRSHDAVIRVYDDAGNVVQTHEHEANFNEW
jgi:hypothetical protein